MPVNAVTSNASTVFNQAREGMERGQRKLERAAKSISEGNVSAEPMVDLIVAEATYGANARVIRTQDEMLGSLLDVKR